ncbi:MAG: N-6 DNA methylase [Vicinamibacterales bacterium]
MSGHLIAEDLLEALLGQEGGSLSAGNVVAGTPASHAAAHRITSTAFAAWRQRTAHLGPSSSLGALAESAVSLVSLLGFERVSPSESGEGHRCSILQGQHTAVVLIVAPWAQPLGHQWRNAVVGAARHGATWGLLFNGIAVRLIRATQLLSRRYVEVDLEIAASDDRTAAVCARLLHARAVDGADGASDSVATLVARSEVHRAAVSRSLRAGVLDATGHVLRALASGGSRSGIGVRTATRPSGFAAAESARIDAAFEQSLTVVYRILFLLFAEGRLLVPMWHPVYRDTYSIESLRARADERVPRGLWDALRAIGRLAHSGCRAGSLRVTPFNGRLFSPLRLPLMERRRLDDSAARLAILALTTRRARDGESLERVSYRALGVEELGAVYETLLDYRPRVAVAATSEATAASRSGVSSNRPADRVSRAGRQHPRLHVTLAAGSGVRKATGTFYTPQPLVSYLIREALAPLIAGATPERVLSIRVLDPSMGSGAFLVGACRYLAAAYRRALIESGRCHPSDFGPAERASIRRMVAERCLYGVDLNPTAVHLAQLSLWLTTLASDRPLSFLDHHLRVGDSLSGTWLSRVREPPVRRRHQDLPLFPEDTLAEALGGVLPIRWRLATAPNETVADVRAKEQALAALDAPDSPLGTWTTLADLWCASWLASPPIPSSLHHTLADALLHGRAVLPQRTMDGFLDRVRETRSRLRLFHWELEFPEVFFDERGARRPDAGFDAVVGNPPWDMIRADAVGDSEHRRVAAASLVRFVRDSGVYQTRTDGHVNCYQLFVDRAIALTRPGGRVGMLLPSGIVSDRGSAAIRRLLFSRCSVERIVGFDNTRATFPIHRSVRFVLLSATAGGSTGEVACRFGETDATTLERFPTIDGRPDPSWFTTRLTMSLLAKLSGEDDLAVPELRTSRDLAIAERAAELFPGLGSEDGWRARFGRELNASEDRSWFHAGRDGWPVLEGKSIEPFRTLLSRVRWRIRPSHASSLLGARPLRARLAYRDVAGPGNRQTLIAAMLPPRSVSTHTLFCLRTPLPSRAQHYLCALLNSFVLNYLVRQRVSTHVTTAIVERLPVPRADQAGPAFAVLARAAAVLARTDAPEIRAGVNALVARLYELSCDDLAHVLDTFPLVDRAERMATLDRYRAGDPLDSPMLTGARGTATRR